MQQKWVEIYTHRGDWHAALLAGKKPRAKKFASLANGGGCTVAVAFQGQYWQDTHALGNPSTLNEGINALSHTFSTFFTHQQRSYFSAWSFSYSQGAAYYTFWGVNVAERDVLGASLCRKRSFWKKGFPPFLCCLIESDVDKVKWVPFLASSQLRDLIKTPFFTSPSSNFCG